MRPHAHRDIHEMILVVGGRLVTRIAGQELTASKSQVLLYPCMEVHQEHADGPEPLETLYFGFRHLPSTGLHPQQPWPLRANDPLGRIEWSLRWMLDLFPARHPVEKDMLQALGKMVILEFRRATEPAESQMVQAVRRHVRAHLAERITLDDLASVIGLSKFHFARLFRQASGQSPMRFVTALRVGVARTLLRTPLPMKAIARQVGFADEYHFSRVFRHHTGMPPSVTRASTGRNATRN